MKLARLRELRLAGAAGGGWLSAASGLVGHCGRLYVIADDELHLGVFEGGKAGRIRRLLPGLLPGEPSARKKAKPDFEVLTAIPPAPACPHGGLLALGSGSTENRRRGVLVPFSATGLARRTIRFDLTPLYARLAETIAGLNIEGAAVRGDRLLLFHRGNRTRPDNLVATVDLQALIESATTEGRADAAIGDVVALPLGDVGGVPLSITDAAPLPDGGLIVTAVAEDTANAYDDGALAGAAICRLNRDLKLTGLWLIDPAVKIEGVEIDGDGVLLVTDADDPSRPAELYRAKLPA